jgi:hypothetical protein
MKIYIDIGVECPANLNIWLPHLEEPMKADKIAIAYPELAAIFDGTAKENTLLFYYCLHETEAYLDFIDAEAEEEVAELMGISITEVEIKEDGGELTEGELTKGELTEGELTKGELTKEDIDMFRADINNIRQELDAVHIDVPQKEKCD